MSKKRNRHRLQMQKRSTPAVEKFDLAQFSAEVEAIASGELYEPSIMPPPGKLNAQTLRRWSAQWQAIRPKLYRHALTLYQQGSGPTEAAEAAVSEYVPWHTDPALSEWIAYSLPTWHAIGQIPD